MKPTRRKHLVRKLKKLCHTLNETSIGLIRGSLVRGQKKCGRKGCACNEGKLHRHVVISTQGEGKSHIVYVPVTDEEQAVASIAAYNETWRLIEEISLINIELFKAGVLSVANPKKTKHDSSRNRKTAI